MVVINDGVAVFSEILREVGCGQAEPLKKKTNLGVGKSKNLLINSRQSIIVTLIL